MLIGILALDEGGALGLGDALPWRCPEDLEFFWETVGGQPLLLGKRTYKSIAKIARRMNCTPYVLSYDRSSKKPAVFNADGEPLKTGTNPLDMVKALVAELEDEGQDIYLCGGRSMYYQFIPHCQVVYYNLIHGRHDADVFAPDLQRLIPHRFKQISHTPAIGVDFYTYVSPSYSKHLV